MSDASQTSEKMDKDNVYAYPNPVRPDYTGLITVTGLTLNADVKIVTVNGTLVAEGRSNGGMFTWDGCDKSGRRVAYTWCRRPLPTARRAPCARLPS